VESKDSDNNVLENLSISSAPAPTAVVMTTGKNSTISSTNQSNQVIGSAMKSSSLIKTPSGSSIFTDSSASNVSSVASLRTKKVSFQSDITICDSNGISTCSNGLRSPNLGQGSNHHPRNDSFLSKEAHRDLFCDGKSIQNTLSSVVEDCSLNAWEDGNTLFVNKSGSFNPTIVPSAKQQIHPVPVTNFSYPHGYDFDPYIAENLRTTSDTSRLYPKKKPSVTKNPLANRNLATNSRASSLQNECKEFELSCESPIPFVICQSEPENNENFPKKVENSQTHTFPECLNFNKKLVSEEMPETPQSENKTLLTQDRCNNGTNAPLYYECCKISDKKDSFDEIQESVKSDSSSDLSSSGDKRNKILRPNDGAKEVSE